MTYSEAMAARVLELEARLRRANRRNRQLAQSRDRWREAFRSKRRLCRHCGGGLTDA